MRYGRASYHEHHAVSSGRSVYSEDLLSLLVDHTAFWFGPLFCYSSKRSYVNSHRTDSNPALHILPQGAHKLLSILMKSFVDSPYRVFANVMIKSS